MKNFKLSQGNSGDDYIDTSEHDTLTLGNDICLRRTKGRDGEKGTGCDTRDMSTFTLSFQQEDRWLTEIPCKIRSISGLKLIEVKEDVVAKVFVIAECSSRP